MSAPTTTTTNKAELFGEKQWFGLQAMPPDGILHLAGQANAAPGPKANLVIGAYRDEHGLPYPLPVVRKAEQKLLAMNLNYEYIPMAGHQPFVEEAVKLMFADTLTLGENATAVQTLSGTGALSLGARLLAHATDAATVGVYISDPTWPNHFAIVQESGFHNVHTYRYYDPATCGLNFEGMKKDIVAAPNGSIFVLHECAHNPTGVDPTHEQWAELADLFLAKQHQVFFDSAYQGYASGSLDVDAFAARYFVKKGIPVMCAQSFSKNLGLYNERVGCLTVSVRPAQKHLLPILKSNLDSLVRSSYSSPPAHGARLAHLILSDNTLRREWEEELAEMAERIKAMRQAVYGHLKELQTPGSWEHITNQIGMFSYLGLTKEQCKYCQDHNVFITLTGRANMAGLTTETAFLLAKTIDAAVTSCNK